MPPSLIPITHGAIAAMFFTIALFFVRFHRDTRDALFACFAAAFVILGVNRILFALSPEPSEGDPTLYLIRSFAYSLILLGIYIKNRS